MRSKVFFQTLRVILHGRSAMTILLGSLLSFSFSIAVILSTFGLMDGFDYLLKSGLRHSSGDVIITSRNGFFDADKDFFYKVNQTSPKAHVRVIQTEAFVLHGEESKGVLVRGVDSVDFQKVTGIETRVKAHEIVVGKVLAEHLNLKIGGDVALTFSKGNASGSSLPGIKIFRVGNIVNHGIYQKDLRFVYADRKEISESLGLGDKINQFILSYQDPNVPMINLDFLSKPIENLKENLSYDFLIKPFWSEYSFLIEAVKIEKFSISLILQLIVIVAVFNILAFVIYTMEKKSQEFFFLRAIGLSSKELMKFWFSLIFVLWFISCIGGYFFTLVFDFALKNLSVFQVPGEIYVLSSFELQLDSMDFFLVFLFSLLWILLAAFLGYLKIKKKTIIEGLRQEFT